MDDIDWSQYLFNEAERVEDSSDNSLVKQNTVEYNGENNGNKISPAIFYTINPCDNYWDEMLVIGIMKEDREDIFRRHLINEFQNLSNYYKKNKHIKLDIHIHFEKKNGRVHSHGVILGLPESYYPYMGELTNMSRKLHKVFGKKHLKSDICADFRWTNQNWTGSYIVKENYLKPCRIVYI